MSRFSFIIPVYNCEKYLESCVNNIKEIPLENYEIILVDDGSIDNSGLICDKLEHKNERVRCIHQKNCGVSAARNRGLKAANGESIIFMDADDSIDTEKLLEVLKVVEANPEIDLAIYGMSFDYYSSGQCYRQDKLSYPITGYMSSVQWMDVFEKLYEVNALSPIWNKVFRKDILEHNQLTFNQSMFLYEDLEFSLRYMANCNVIYNVSDCIYHYRQSEDEGNAGRRLKRIEHLPGLIHQVEKALDDLIEAQWAEKRDAQIKSVLISLYLVLAREKIAVSNVKEIQQICDDFAVWAQDRELEIPSQHQKFAGWILNRKVYTLLNRKYYVAFRHRIAVWVKNTKWYQKRKEYFK